MKQSKVTITSLIFILFVAQFCFGQKKLTETQIEVIKSDDTEQFASAFKTPQDCNAIDEDGLSALAYASTKRASAAVKFLLAHGADVNYKIKSEDEDYNGKTALDLAIEKDDEDTYLAFLNAKLNAEMAGKLICLVETVNDIEKLLSFGVDINKIKCDEEPIFIKAVESNKIDFIKLLINKGADLNIKDADGMAAVFYAQPEGLKTLITNKVNLTVTYKNQDLFQDWIDTYMSFFSNGYELDNVAVLLEYKYILPKNIDGKSITDYVKSKPYEKPQSPNMKITVDEAKDQARFNSKKEKVLDFLKTKGIK